MISAPPIIDTHCHLDYLARQGQEENLSGFDPASVLARAQSEGVAFIVNPSVSPKHYADVLKIAEQHSNVYMAVAIHPTDVEDTGIFPDWESQVESLLQHPKVVAIGETGLDYYWSQDANLIALQKKCLHRFLQWGVQYDKPVILHDRNLPEISPSEISQTISSEAANILNSHRDIVAAVKQVPGVRGIMHCFSGDADFALEMISLGFYISFAGNLTFKKASNLHEAAKTVPLENILVETDSPFLSPVPFRGKPNEPARVRYVVEKIAELKGVSYEEVAAITTRNAYQVFNIPNN